MQDDYLISMFHVPLLHLQVRNWNIKKLQLMEILNGVELKIADGDEVHTDFHHQFKNNWDRSRIDQLKHLFEEEFEAFCNHFSFSSYQIKGSWFEVAKKHDYHPAHNHHPLGYVAVCYVQYDENIHKPVYFISPFTNFTSGATLYHHPKNVKEGSILFFPASIIHETRPNKSDLERIVVTFNIDTQF